MLVWISQPMCQACRFFMFRSYTHVFSCISIANLAKHQRSNGVKLRSNEVKMIRKVPVIQKYGKIRYPGTKKDVVVKISPRLFPLMMTKWLQSENFAKQLLGSKSASMVEASHALHYNKG